MRGTLLTHVDGFSDVKDKQLFVLRIENGTFCIDFVKLGFFKHPVQETRKIKLNNIFKITLTTRKEIQKSNSDIDKSVIGRGVGGALIFGPIGAVLGGMSAVVANNKPILVVTYLASSGEIKNIVFATYGAAQESGLRRQYKKEFKKIENLEKSDELKKAIREYQGLDDNGFL